MRRRTVPLVCQPVCINGCWTFPIMCCQPRAMRRTSQRRKAGK